MKRKILLQRQSLSMNEKVNMSFNKIREFYDRMDGEVYVAFSGGKDSTVLLHLVRKFYPWVPAVFVDTGLEFPEIKTFVRTINNVVRLRPEMSFYQVIQKYGYPVVSKEQSLYIRQYRTTKSAYLKKVRWEGKGKKFKISERWKFLVNAPFKISEQCCDIMKKNPVKKFEKKAKLKPYLGIMASDSHMRERLYLKDGCNILTKNKEKSMPLSFWLEEDVWDYIEINKLPYAEIYDKGADRTGCIFCMFGMFEEETDRFEILKRCHPGLYKYCMDKLGLAEVIDFILMGLEKRG